MTALRPIETEGFAKVSAPSSFGVPPRMEWLPISSLVVDPEYQREITKLGRQNVRRICEGFNWTMFAPVIVAPAGSGRFAIVDGQHRTTAAALVGVNKVPCCIIDAAPGEQAASFRAINGNTTKLHPIQLFHAAVAAGDPASREIVDVAGEAGIVISRTLGKLKDRQTFCVGAIGKGIERYGRATVVLALKAIVRSGEGRSEDLGRSVITSAIEVLARHPEWVAKPDFVFRVFETFDLEDMWRAAAAAAAQIKGSSTLDQLQASITEGLAFAFKKRGHA